MSVHLSSNQLTKYKVCVNLYASICLFLDLKFFNFNQNQYFKDIKSEKSFNLKP